MRKVVFVGFVTLVSVVTLFTSVATAHGIPGAMGTLEGVPPWLYAGSGAIVVVASFVILGAFTRKEKPHTSSYQRRYIESPFPGFVKIVRVFFVVLYLGVIIIGLFGPSGVLINPYPTIGTEILWWVGYGIFALVIGDFWPLINPWKTLFEWMGEPSLQREYPKRLGVLPAFILFMVFVYLNFIIALTPLLTGAYAALFGILMILGMGLYGKEEWLWYGDPFTRIFDFFGKVGIVNVRENGLEFRKWGVGLLSNPVQYKSEIAFVVAMVYTLSFDGYKDTPYYTEVNLQTVPEGVAFDLWTAVMGGLQLVAGLIIFLLAYVVCVVFMRYVARTDRSTVDMAKRFVVTLIPIAGAYHIAHYSLYFFLSHELVVQTISNPLPGNEIRPDPDLMGFLTVEFVWYYMAAFIVIGHVMAVWVAHYDSLDYFEDRGTAIRSQIPMLVLMVLYTMVSLWIISQPFGG